MSSRQWTLRERQSEMTRGLIMQSAIDLLTEGEPDLSVRSTAARAGISERTVFRYFANRDELLDCVATEINARLAPPPVPESLEQLPTYPAAIFARFEETAALTRAALRGEVYERIRSNDLARRGATIARLVDEAAPHLDPSVRRLVATNIHYHVVASTWNYYRTRFKLSARDTVAAARLAIEHAIAALREGTAG